MLSNNHDVTAHRDMEKRLKEISPTHMKVAYRAHMSNHVTNEITKGFLQ
jgi:thiamine phosphate synthase YjbQ (UPF0047 family)